MIPLRWIGPVFDTSGYASATRGYLRGLIESKEFDLSVGAVTFEKEKTTHGNFTDLVKPVLNREIEFDIQVTHLTPENYPGVRNKDALYNIAYTVWETDRLPHSWVELCNLMDEIWVPSEWNVEVFRKSGVTKHIHVVPHIIEVKENVPTQKVSLGVDDDTFVFYSIFQWIERKNPIALLKAYLTEFTADEKVCLALKSYRVNATAQEQSLIKQEIARVKKALNMPTAFPEMRFFGKLLTAEQMAGFHDRGDCFVLPHRGEGFGIPHAEAMALGKPVIATGYSGNLEFMNKENSYLVDHQLTPVCNMIFPNYFGYMNWAEPSVSHLRALMREVYEHQQEAKKVGERGKQDVSERLSRTRIVQNIVDRVKQIQENLNG